MKRLWEIQVNFSMFQTVDIEFFGGKLQKALLRRSVLFCAKAFLLSRDLAISTSICCPINCTCMSWPSNDRSALLDLVTLYFLPLFKKREKYSNVVAFAFQLSCGWIDHDLCFQRQNNIGLSVEVMLFSPNFLFVKGFLLSAVQDQAEGFAVSNQRASNHRRSKLKIKKSEKTRESFGWIDSVLARNARNLFLTCFCRFLFPSKFDKIPGQII